MILPCPQCKPHEFQDETYGKNKRVFNPRFKSGSKSIIGYRCTVCGYCTTPPKQEKIITKKEE